MKTILFIANNNIGDGLSGGDRIFLELARYWSSKIKVTIFGSQETANLLKKYTVPVNIILTDRSDTSPIIIHQIRRVFKAIGVIIKNHRAIFKFNYIYSVSDFYPELIPSLIIKLFNPKVKWIAGYYLNAPNPLLSSSPYNQTGQFFKGLIYFLGQIPTKIIINLFADIVFITSEPDKKYFPDKKIVIIRGGVDTSFAQSFLKSKIKTTKVFDAVFLGRLHPQKGVLELIDIWKMVVAKIPTAKLAIIGDGALEAKIIQKIGLFNLKSNIKMFGFLDGPVKHGIFKKSRIVVHPATYDSGGMAAAEAMSFGLPGVSFDLEALKTYYPHGMVKTVCFNYQEFTNNIIKLLSDKKYYQQQSLQAIKLINDHWVWSKQSEKIYQETFL